MRLFTLVLAGAVSFAGILENQAHAEILRFQEVAPGIYRGSQPESPQDYDLLQDLGIRTIINLRTSDDLIAQEGEIAEARGMRFLSFPMNSFFAPKKSKINAILSELTRPENQPVFVHCKHGKDRTGLVIGLYRVEFENVDRHEAYAEMRAIGFNPWLWGLERTFWKRTRKHSFSDALGVPSTSF